MNDVLLVINAGSSSIKCSFFTCDTPLQGLYRIDITGLGGSHPGFLVRNSQGNIHTQQTLTANNHQEALAVLLDWIEQCEEGFQVQAVGHRVVHGGEKFKVPVLLTDSIVAQLEQFVPLAPLHQPHNLAPIKAFSQLKQDLLQVACFDTAFHATQPWQARSFALPYAWTDQGLRRYGFHGLSYEYIAQSLPKFLGTVPQRVVVAHLGNGASMAALKEGQSIATTMGFTALEGLPMGTRCGSIDPGILLYLLKGGMALSDLHHLLYHQSGLLGMSGLSNDMQELLKSDAPRAKEAVEFFVYRLGRELGSLVAALEGLDALIFTAGIGEHAPWIRAQVCQQATWLGIKLDDQANEQHGPQISASTSQVSVWVIPTNEEKMIAQHTYSLISSAVPFLG